MEASLRTWQIRYCKSEYETCLRYQRSERGELVPRELLPNGMSLPVKHLK